jgi:sugar phosphate isomerase/epimerase
VKYHLEELLPLSIDYAKDVGASTIVTFSFHRGDAPAGEAPDEVLEVMQEAAVRAGEAGITLAIEVEDEFWADTGATTAGMVKAINHPALRVNWDPGNAFVAGDIPYPYGYQAIREHLSHVHFKDVTRNSNGGHEYVVEGQIDWQGQVEALVQDGYDGYISVETHMEPKVKSAREVTERLHRLLETATVKA